VCFRPTQHTDQPRDRRGQDPVLTESTLKTSRGQITTHEITTAGINILVGSDKSVGERLCFRQLTSHCAASRRGGERRRERRAIHSERPGGGSRGERKKCVCECVYVCMCVSVCVRARMCVRMCARVRVCLCEREHFTQRD
jgi:hypothetical protein